MLPPILPGGPPYRSDEDPERERRLEQLSQGYEGSPWLTLLVNFSGFLAVFAGSFVAMFLLGNLGNGGAWIPYALLLAALVGAHAGLRAVRHHRRRAAGHGQAVSAPPGNLARWGRRHRLPLLALALAAATGAGLLVASPWQRPGPAPPSVERALAAVLDAGAPGLVAQVQDGARSWTEAKGLANLGRRAPMRPADRFRIASLTKTYVAAVTLQLAAERRLGLDDPAARYLPGLLRDGAQITVRQLLNHTSGLAETASLPAVQDARDTGAIPPRTQVRLADAHPRRYRPWLPAGVRRRRGGRHRKCRRRRLGRRRDRVHRWRRRPVLRSPAVRAGAARHLARADAHHRHARTTGVRQRLRARPHALRPALRPGLGPPGHPVQLHRDGVRGSRRAPGRGRPCQRVHRTLIGQCVRRHETSRRSCLLPQLGWPGSRAATRRERLRSISEECPESACAHTSGPWSPS